MNLNDLRLFIRVIETGSFTAAGETLGVQKSTISRRIAQLEDDMGVRLLQRSTRRLQLTDEGQSLFERCGPLLDELEQTQAEVAATHTEPRGRLRLTMPPELGAFIMNGVVASFSQRYPQIELDIELSTRLTDLIEEGIDLAIRVGTLTDSTMVGRKLAEINLGLYASPAYLTQCGEPKTPDDLREHNCLGMRKADNSWAFQNWRDGEPLPITGRLRANSLTFLRGMILQNIGIARMPRSFVADEVKRGELRQLLPDFEIAPIDVHAVYPSRRHLNPKVRLFIDHAQEQLKSHSWVTTH